MSLPYLCTNHGSTSWGHAVRKEATSHIDYCHANIYRSRLHEIASENWGTGDDEMRQKMSVMASAAAWGLGHWDNMEEYVHSISGGTMVYPFFQSVLHIHKRQFSVAQKVSIIA